MTPIQSLESLILRLNELAPTLAPQPTPRDLGYGIDLLFKLCCSVEQKEAIKTLVRDLQSRAPVDQQEFILQGQFNKYTKTFDLVQACCVSQVDAKIHRFIPLMELIVNSGRNDETQQEELQLLVSRFLIGNGHSETDKPLLDECMNVAYAIQVILRAFPEVPLSIKGNKIDTITAATDVEALFKPLFQSTSSKKTKTGAKITSKKSRKRKTSKN